MPWRKPGAPASRASRAARLPYSRGAPNLEYGDGVRLEAEYCLVRQLVAQTFVTAAFSGGGSRGLRISHQLGEDGSRIATIVRPRLLSRDQLKGSSTAIIAHEI